MVVVTVTLHVNVTPSYKLLERMQSVSVDRAYTSVF